MFSGQALGDASFVGVGGKVTVPSTRRGLGHPAAQAAAEARAVAVLARVSRGGEAERRDVTSWKVFLPRRSGRRSSWRKGAEARKEARERYEEAETKSAQLAD